MRQDELVLVVMEVMDEGDWGTFQVGGCIQVLI
jgi:hypothetical protein